MRLLIKLEGGQGVGNQLWNYAAIYNYAYHKNLDTVVDASTFDKLNELLGEIPLYLFHDLYVGERYSEIELDSIFAFNDVFLSEESIGKAIASSVTEGDSPLIWIKGLMQDVNNLCGFETTPLYQFIKAGIDTSVSDTADLVVHVRGGDYLSTTTCLTRGYYQRALNIADPDGSLSPTVVTNDLRYARWLLPEGIVSAQGEQSTTSASHHIGGNVRFDFLRMATAKRLVSSNSTFAFWSAYFSDGEVYMPDKWFAHNYSRDLSSPSCGVGGSVTSDWMLVPTARHGIPRVSLSRQGILSKALYQLYRTAARIRGKYIIVTKKTDWDRS